MSFAADLRALADSIRAIPESLGVRLYTVTVRVETFANAIADGSVPTSASDAVISPRPRVVKLPPHTAIAYGGGPLASGNGIEIANVFRVGNITRSFVAGGYDLVDLLPPNAVPTTRVTLVISGEELGAGVPFTAIDYEITDTSLALIVREVTTL